MEKLEDPITPTFTDSNNFFGLTIIYEINDPSAKYVNLEKNLIIRLSGLALRQVWWIGMGINILKIAEIR